VEKINFVGQAAAVLKTSAAVHRFYNDESPNRKLLDEYLQKQVEAQYEKGEYRIPRRKLLDMDESVLEDMNQRLQEFIDERHISVSVETDDTGDYIVKWWKE